MHVCSTRSAHAAAVLAAAITLALSARAMRPPMPRAMP